MMLEFISELSSLSESLFQTFLTNWSWGLFFVCCGFISVPLNFTQVSIYYCNTWTCFTNSDKQKVSKTFCLYFEHMHVHINMYICWFLHSLKPNKLHFVKCFHWNFFVITPCFNILLYNAKTFIHFNSIFSVQKLLLPLYPFTYKQRCMMSLFKEPVM